MEKIILKLIEMFNPLQTIFLITLGMIIYFKLKEGITKLLIETKNEINKIGLNCDD